MGKGAGPGGFGAAAIPALTDLVDHYIEKTSDHTYVGTT